jgi:hypothetical protein
VPAARRIYLYAISGLTLGLLAGGLTSLIRVALEAAGLGSGPAVVIGEAARVEQLSGALALAAVAGPVWLLHWAWLERSVQPGRPLADEERSSVLRGLYLTIVLWVVLGLGASATFTLLSAGLVTATGGEPADLGPAAVLPDAIAWAIVAGAVWVYHATVRRRDLAAAPVAGAAAWLPRAYLYASALTGIVLLAIGLAELLGLALSTQVGAPAPIVDGEGTATRLARSVTLTGVASVLWLGHFGYSLALLAAPGWRGAAERPSRTRLGYLALVLFLAASAAIGMLAEVGSAGVLVATGEQAVDAELPAIILHPTLLAVVYGIGAALHIGWMRGDARVLAEPGRDATVWRLERYILALIGLFTAAGGVAGLVSVVIRSLAGGVPLGGATDTLALDLAFYLPSAVVGSIVWFLAWVPVVRRTERDPETEAASTARRAFLLLVLATALVAGVVSAAVILYRLLVTLLGGDLTGAAIAELGLPLGIVLTATTAGLYHWSLLRRDLRLAAPAEPAADELPGEPEPEAAPVAVPGEAPAEGGWESEGGAVRADGVALTLRGPDGADLEDALRAARAALPEGYRLERD